MNGLRILLLLVPLHFAATSGPASAQATPPEPGTEVRAEGTRPSEPSTVDDREAILAVLRGVEAAFSELDLAGWLSHFHSDFLLMAPDGVAALGSEAEAAALVQPLMEGLRARGYARSEMDRATVRLLSPTIALAAVEWSRFGADGEEIGRLGATYAFFKGDAGWKIVMVTVHPPETPRKMG
jgi:ketosteroid isomerase-like protein